MTVRPCAQPGCSQLVKDGRRCPKHAARHDAYKAEAERARQAECRERYSARWKVYSRQFIKENPFCVGCGGAAREVDHKTAWRRGRTEEERYALFWAESNHQPLCRSCHSRKTATFDGGWGHDAR